MKVPAIVQEVYQDPADCYVIVKDTQYDDKCTIQDDKITYNGAFSELPSDLRSGSIIQLSFKTKNPHDNKDIRKDAYEITVYDGPDYETAYGIDELKGELFHSLECDYHC